MPPFTQPPRDLHTVEQAVRDALDHASAYGDHATAAELAAILKALTLRAGGGWDTVSAGPRAH
jgi:hypothetical protein